MVRKKRRQELAEGLSHVRAPRGGGGGGKETHKAAKKRKRTRKTQKAMRLRKKKEGKRGKLGGRKSATTSRLPKKKTFKIYCHT